MKPRKDFLTDEQVEQEIERLNQSDAVQLSRQEQRIKYKRRQYQMAREEREAVDPGRSNDGTVGIDGKRDGSGVGGK